MENINKNQLRQLVQERYSVIADNQSSCCGTDAACCGGQSKTGLDAGYTPELLNAIPQGADLGLSCGNPNAHASLKPGETVLDLGSGGGMDVFIAARAVGKEGKVIGVDMSSSMIALARENILKGDYPQVEFRLGEIEHLPVADDTVDVILSNCVINLSPEKEQVFHEAFRVLKPGGRLSISDVLRLRDLPDHLINDAAYCACISGAASIPEITAYLEAAGFEQIRITPASISPDLIDGWLDQLNTPQAVISQPASADNYVISAIIEAVKPA